MKKIKLNVLLARTDALASTFKNLVNDYTKFFSRSQGAFLGERRTYTALPDTIDEPNKRGTVLIQTTVDEKFDWFTKTAKDYIDSLFAQEATNASGNVSAILIVEGKDWGQYSSLELLRLKSLIETRGFIDMINSIPVRSDSDTWENSNDAMYKDRSVFETDLMEGDNITTIKEDYILKDPNISKDASNYVAEVSQKTTIKKLGKYTKQNFTGQWSQKERAEALRKRNVLYVAVIEALKECNDAEAIPSDMTAKKLFGYLFNQ